MPNTRRYALGALFALAIIVAGALWAWAPWGGSADRGLADFASRAVPTPTTPPPTPDPLIYRPLSAEEAKTTNEDIPFASIPLEVARAFAFPGGASMPLARRSAIDCLTAAVYYESGYETLQGKRAVAQVVLNRVRHPAFPNSVCAVVYQGAERRTGCQFTFTCDGSLGRSPARASWQAARNVAEAALGGFVEPSVGMATHYHADYVVPYWASSLDKIASIGAHLFYNWKGAWGRRAAFTQIPRADSPELAVDPADALADVVADESLTTAIVLPPSPIIADDLPGLTQPPPPPSPTPTARELEADRAAGTLKIDEAAPTLQADEGGS